MLLTDWLTTRLIDWLLDWLPDWLTDCLTDFLTEWITEQLPACLTHDYLTDWITEHWLIQITRSTDWLTDWLTDYLTNWLMIRKTSNCLISLISYSSWLIERMKSADGISYLAKGCFNYILWKTASTINKHKIKLKSQKNVCWNPYYTVIRQSIPLTRRKNRKTRLTTLSLFCGILWVATESTRGCS